MSERTDLILRPDDPNEGPDILEQLRRSVESLIPASTEATGRFLKAKADEQAAKAARIKAEALKLIGDLAVQRERLKNERDEAAGKLEAGERESRRKHEERMFELQTKRFNAVVESFVRLRELGVRISLTTFLAQVRVAAVANESTSDRLDSSSDA